MRESANQLAVKAVRPLVQIVQRLATTLVRLPPQFLFVVWLHLAQLRTEKVVAVIMAAILVVPTPIQVVVRLLFVAIVLVVILTPARKLIAEIVEPLVVAIKAMPLVGRPV